MLLQCCLGCDTLILPSPTTNCSHQRCIDCCQRLPLPCVLHTRAAEGISTDSELCNGVVVADLGHGRLLVQATRGDGLQYTGVLSTDESTLLDITPLPASPLLSTITEMPSPTSASPPWLSSADAISTPAKRRYVRSGIYSKKNRAGDTLAHNGHAVRPISQRLTELRLHNCRRQGGDCY